MVTELEMINLPLQLFHELKSEKRHKILNSALEEFSCYGYYEGSTNRIIKEAAISKGSLYKYFASKEDLYFFLLDNVILNLSSSFKEYMESLPTDPWERIIKCAELEIDWYIQHPNQYKFIKRAFSPNETAIYHQTILKYGEMGLNFYQGLLKTIDETAFKGDSTKALNIIRWFLLGFNEEFMRSIDEFSDLHEAKNRYIEKLRGYIEMLKGGL